MQAVHSGENIPVAKIKYPALQLLSNERVLVGVHIFVAVAALALGLLMGPFQAFRRSPGLTQALGGAVEMPIFSYYYQALTLHGILNALVFTTFFIVGFAYFVTQRSLQRRLSFMPLAWTAFGLMFVGLVLTAYPIITGQANVLYTFYAPLIAHWTFYVGLTLLIVGSWVSAFVVGKTYFGWRADNPGQPVPLAVFGLFANYVMWFTASLGVAVEVLTMLLPLSLNIIATTDPQVSRILFWFFGHPLVYFWLLPAYVSWYTMIPKQLGVTLYSDSMARVAFIMLMIFSIPIGVHHLFVDPGVSEFAKISHSLLTFVVAVPSLLTAFNLAATFEKAGRKRGGNLISWIWKQPWGDPIIASQIWGMLLFIIGGITGIMNASFTFNMALHNTTWIVGHFHLTLAGAVTMTYFSVLYWLIPLMRGRKLYRPKLAVAQIYTWAIGMIMFGGGMGRAGVEGAIRRTDMGDPGAYIAESWAAGLNLSALAGAILLVSSVLLYIVLIGTWYGSKEELDASDEPPIHTSAPAESKPSLFENWGLWAALIIISNVVMWGPVLLQALDFVNGFFVPGQPGAAR